MAIRLYDPFENLNFDPQTCFLSGEDLHTEEEQIPVFPQWIIDRYSLHEKKLVMMDQITSFRYPDLKIPCSDLTVKTALDPLEEEIERAFTSGYEEVKKLSGERLFQWMAKLLYGVLYNDLLIEKEKAARRKKEFKLSILLQKRFKKLHLMLQSLVAVSYT